MGKRRKRAGSRRRARTAAREPQASAAAPSGGSDPKSGWWTAAAAAGFALIAVGQYAEIEGLVASRSSLLLGLTTLAALFGGFFLLWWVIRSHGSWWLKVAACGLVLAPAVGLVLSWAPTLSTPRGGAPEPGDSGQLPSLERGELRVLVADFAGPEAEEYRFTDFVIRGIGEELGEDPGIEVLGLGRSILEIEGSAEAVSVARARGANVVVWGWYARSEEALATTVHVDMVTPPLALPAGLVPYGDGTKIFDSSEHKGFSIQATTAEEVSAALRLIAGATRFEANDWERAAALLLDSVEQLETLEPADRAELWYYLGAALYNAGRHPEAVHWLERARGDSQDGDLIAIATLALAGSHATLGDSEQALALLAELMDDPDFKGVAALQISEILSLTGRPQAALAALEPLVDEAVGPLHAVALASRGLVRTSLGGQMCEAGLADLASSVAIQDDDKSVMRYAMGLARCGQFEKGATILFDLARFQASSSPSYSRQLAARATEAWALRFAAECDRWNLEWLAQEAAARRARSQRRGLSEILFAAEIRALDRAGATDRAVAVGELALESFPRSANVLDVVLSVHRRRAIETHERSKEFRDDLPRRLQQLEVELDQLVEGLGVAPTEVSDLQLAEVEAERDALMQGVAEWEQTVAATEDAISQAEALLELSDRAFSELPPGVALLGGVVFGPRDDGR